jgi:hypothetical protein
MKKKRALPPRRHRMKRPARLQSARTWLARFEGNDVIRSYARWYAVDNICAIKELQMLGVSLPAERLTAIHASMINRKPKPPKPSSNTEVPQVWGDYWVDDFPSMDELTEGGEPFGIRWEEYEVLDPEGGKPAGQPVREQEADDAFDLPF